MNKWNTVIINIFIVLSTNFNICVSSSLVLINFCLYKGYILMLFASLKIFNGMPNIVSIALWRWIFFIFYIFLNFDLDFIKWLENRFRLWGLAFKNHLVGPKQHLGLGLSKSSLLKWVSECSAQCPWLREVLF